MTMNDNRDDALSECGYSTGITAGAKGVGISVHVDELTADEARELSGALARLSERLTPASGEPLRYFQVPLQAINDARGTHHTVESLAQACGVDLGALTKADVTAMAVYIGGTLMRKAG